MDKICLIRVLFINILILITIDLRAQETVIDKEKPISHDIKIDSIYNTLREKGIDTIVLFFQDGYFKTGFIVFEMNSIVSGIAFKINQLGEVTTKAIKKKYLKKIRPIKMSFVNQDLICHKLAEKNIELSHDINILFHFYFNDKECASLIPLSVIASNGNYELARFYEKFSWLYYRTIKEIDLPKEN